MSSKSSKQVRVGLYARVSTSGHGQDVGLQLDELRSVAAQRGWQVAGEFIDEGVSGSTRERPGLDRLMAAAKTGKVDVVVVWRFDRFARSVSHLLEALETFRALKVEFVSLRVGIDTGTATGRMVFTMIGAIAGFERELIRERVRAGVARAKSAGKHCGRPRRDLDLRAAVALLGQGHGLRQVASMLGLPRSTLRRRLADAGVTVESGAHVVSPAGALLAPPA